MKRICVFCSAASGLDPLFYAEATRFAEALSERDWELVYGAGVVGLMGSFADEALKRGVRVRGAIPECLATIGEVMHRGLTEVALSKDLFERKRWMLENSDAFAIYPGGFGTLDEALEVITWKQLGQHAKPIVWADLKGYWQPQLESHERLSQAGAIPKDALKLYEVAGSTEALFRLLDAGLAPSAA